MTEAERQMDYSIRVQALNMAVVASRDSSGPSDPMEYVEDFYDFLSGKINGMPEPELNEFNVGDDDKVIDFAKARKDYDLSD